MHQLRRVSLDLTQISTGVSMLDSHIAVLSPAERLETFAKCNDPSQHFGIILIVWMQECDAPHALVLLPARRERPCCRAAEQRNGLAPSRVEHRHIRASSHPRTAARAAGDRSRYLGTAYSATLRV